MGLEDSKKHPGLARFGGDINVSTTAAQAHLFKQFESSEVEQLRDLLNLSLASGPKFKIEKTRDGSLYLYRDIA